MPTKARGSLSWPSSSTESRDYSGAKHVSSLLNSRACANSVAEASDLSHQSIAALQLSVRASNCLAKRDIATLGKLVQLTETELLSWTNLGRRTLREISDALAALGLRLGMTADEISLQRTPDTWVRTNPEPLHQASLDLPPITSVAAESALLDFLRRFPAREYAVISERIIECTATLEQLGSRFDVTRERIRQIEQRLSRRIRSFLSSPEGQGTRRLAQRVRADLGAAVPADSVSPYFLEQFPSLGSDDERALITSLLLWIAGPYESFETWRVADPTLASATLGALKASRDSKHWLSPATTQEILIKADIRTPYHASWLCTLGFFEIDGGWLLRLSSILDRVEQILRYRGVPMTAEELLPWVDCESVRSLRNRLLEDDRFKRTTRYGHFALRQWSQYDEYSGIAEEIAEEIARQGGVADAQHLIEVISERYGVKPNSVHQYLSAPMFIRIGEGRVRLRAPDEMRTVRSDPRICPGLYRVNDQWVLRVRITADTLRGSGRALHPSVAALVGCQPGERRVFKSPCDEVVISWPPGSACGPSLGSLRPDVEALGGAIDDYVFLSLGTAEIGVRLLKAAELAHLSNELQLALLVGLSSSTLAQSRWDAIGSAIGLRTESQTTPEDVHAGLMRRNEVTLAQLIDLPDDPQAIFTQLESILGL